MDDSKPAGFLGIPGSPSVSLVLAFAWAVWVGWIFSTVGAFGGVMAGVGHMSVFGFGTYAGAFKKNRAGPGQGHHRLHQGLQPVPGGTFGGHQLLQLPEDEAPGPAAGHQPGPWAPSSGAWGAQELSAGKLDFKSYQGYFGLFVLLLGAWLFYETTPAGQAKKKTAKAAAKAFEDAIKKQKCGETLDAGCDGLHIKEFTASTCAFTFYGVPFQFNPIMPFAGGVVISAVAAFLGVGGGFLLVPFLTSVTQLPMYLAAGTSALAVLVGMITSIITLMTKGTPIEWGLIGIELVGITIGSIIGPMTSKYLSDVWLKRLFIVLSLYVGVGYLLAGFFGIKIPGV